jgi:hypothetical protein
MPIALYQYAHCRPSCSIAECTVAAARSDNDRRCRNSPAARDTTVIVGLSVSA